jgi:hypothetical protein
MATFFIGDVHGCSQELSQLLAVLALGPEDEVLFAGDLFDRGPDPLGVLDLVEQYGSRSVMSNHEDYLLHALEKVGRGVPFETRHEYVIRCLRQVAPQADRFHAFLRALPLFRRGPGWLLVHAGIDPDRGAEASDRETLLNVRAWPKDQLQAPQWYESYTGSELVVFGHNARRQAVMHRHEGTLVAVGLDTGCVYGGKLTAFHLEQERLIQVDAARDYRKG